MQEYTTGTNKYKFTEKERDNETSYDYFGARYYNNKLGVWLSADPLAEKYPGFSPFNCCINNPMILVDPTGMSFEDGFTTVYKASSDDESPQNGPDGKDKKKKSGNETNTNNSTTVNTVITVGGVVLDGIYAVGKGFLSALGISITGSASVGAGSLVFLQGDTDPHQAAEMRAERAKNEGGKSVDKANDSNAPDPNGTYTDKQGNEYKFKPKKNWDGKTDSKGNYPTKGRETWGPKTTHDGTHNTPHHDIQWPNKTHTPVVKK